MQAGHAQRPPVGRQPSGQRVDPEQRRPDQHRAEQVQGVFADVHPLVVQGQAVDRRQLGAEQHDREQPDRAGRTGQHRHRPRVQPPRQPSPAIAATGEQRQPDRPAGSQQRRDDQPHHHVLDHVRGEMVVGQRTDPRVEVDHQHREPADEAGAAAQRPTPPSAVSATADLGGEQVDDPARHRQQRERQADRPVGAPLGGERVQAHLDRPPLRPYWKISVVQSPPGRWISCGRAPSLCSAKSTKKSSSSA